jgi:Glycosyltransferase Family 4
MKIWLLQDHLRNGGTERQTLLLAQAFQADGHEVTVVVFRPGGRLAASLTGLSSRVLQPVDTGLNWFAPGLLRAARAAAPDVILCMGRMANCHAGRLARALQRTVVLGTLRTGKPLPWLFRRSLRAVAHVVANSAESAACAVIKKSLFESIHGFDPSYMNGGEDIDLCLRLHARGYWHYVSHHSEILHHKGASPGRKTYNDVNIVRLQAAHGDYLRRRLVPRDSRLAALSYLDSALSAPLRINGPKLFSALLTISRPHPFEALRKPDNIS